MTVSVVLNKSRSGTRVSEAARLRIEETAARLQYRPNAAARGMKRRRMDTIGVVAVYNGYLLDVLGGILEAAAEREQNTTVFSVKDWDKDERKMLRFCDGRVDGVILIGPCISDTFAETLGQHAPFVSVHPGEPQEGVWRVEVDDEGGAYEVVRHLISLGHRQIAHLAGPLHLSNARERLLGYRRALEEAGIPFDEALVAQGGYVSGESREPMAQLLDAERGSPFPTAIFCANDSSAVGCLEALAERRLRVPEDISVAGFDDAYVASMTIPQLTTARQPFGELGRRAVEMLLEQVEGASAASSGGVMTPRAEIVDSKLVVRASTGPPPPPATLPGNR